MQYSGVLGVLSYFSVTTVREHFGGSVVPQKNNDFEEIFFFFFSLLVDQMIK